MKKQDLLQEWKKMGIFSPEIEKAFTEVQREQFIEPQYRNQAYEDHPLPIPASQTISQPTTVALMTYYLNAKKGMNILEVGTGSGYQAAILARIVAPGHVYTTEIIDDLFAFSKNNLSSFANVTVLHHDGSAGLARFAPYDRIIVTAACPEIPKKLIDQLKPHGVLLAPVGSPYQSLLHVTKNDTLTTENLGDFTFVPLTGKFGFRKA